MPIALTEFAKYHPSRLTRQSDNPVISGNYSLEAIMNLYGGKTEAEALRNAAMKGQAFFKKPNGYTAFNPVAGETSDLPLDGNLELVAIAPGITAPIPTLDPVVAPTVAPIVAPVEEVE